MAYQVGVADQLPSQPQEGLLEVVIGFGGDIVVLKILLPVEGNCLCFNLTFLYVHLVTSEDDRDLLADTDKIACEVY